MTTPPDFSVGQVLTAAQMNAVGLWLIDTKEVSAQTELIVDGCYTSDFTNYQIVARIYTSSADSFYQNRSGGSNANSGYNRQLLEIVGGTVNAVRVQNQAQFTFTSNSNGANWMSAIADIFSPAEAKPTGIQIAHNRTDTNYNNVSLFGFYGNHATASAYDGFRVFVNSGTLTGKVWVYGRRD